ncbi:hypothetical protein GQ44DRAFT_127430, partial [Phaeosphaeriaceae sp. PMI808]
QQTYVLSILIYHHTYYSICRSHTTCQNKVLYPATQLTFGYLPLLNQLLSRVARRSAHCSPIRRPLCSRARCTGASSHAGQSSTPGKLSSGVLWVYIHISCRLPRHPTRRHRHEPRNRLQARPHQLCLLPRLLLQAFQPHRPLTSCPISTSFSSVFLTLLLSHPPLHQHLAKYLQMAPLRSSM